ncbi:MAG TPA: T9SS type A sorting domain-containing protein, partial [Chitinophagaceae bacterium]|nr:T9SS type A sorting domain-containing protein [Chitinophagaceae bacterium]
FTGTYSNKGTILNWQAANEVDFARYEVERSSNGFDFSVIGSRNALGNNMAGKQQYQYNDDLSAINGNVFYYRLKMVDIDGKAVYSNIVLIRKDEKNINGISIAPNPVMNGVANVRFTSSSGGSVELRVVDLSGKMVLRQQNQIYAGNNSISLNDLSRLQSGIYTLQVADGEMLVATKFSIIR